MSLDQINTNQQQRNEINDIINAKLQQLEVLRRDEKRYYDSLLSTQSKSINDLHNTVLDTNKSIMRVYDLVQSAKNLMDSIEPNSKNNTIDTVSSSTPQLVNISKQLEKSIKLSQNNISNSDNIKIHLLKSMESSTAYIPLIHSLLDNVFGHGSEGFSDILQKQNESIMSSFMATISPLIETVNLKKHYEDIQNGVSPLERINQAYELQKEKKVMIPGISTVQLTLMKTTSVQLSRNYGLTSLQMGQYDLLRYALSELTTIRKFGFGIQQDVLTRSSSPTAKQKTLLESLNSLRFEKTGTGFGTTVEEYRSYGQLISMFKDFHITKLFGVYDTMVAIDKTLMAIKDFVHDIREGDARKSKNPIKEMIGKFFDKFFGDLGRKYLKSPEELLKEAGMFKASNVKMQEFMGERFPNIAIEQLEYTKSIQEGVQLISQALTGKELSPIEKKFYDFVDTNIKTESEYKKSIEDYEKKLSNIIELKRLKDSSLSIFGLFDISKSRIGSFLKGLGIYDNITAKKDSDKLIKVLMDQLHVSESERNISRKNQELFDKLINTQTIKIGEDSVKLSKYNVDSIFKSLTKQNFKKFANSEQFTEEELSKIKKLSTSAIRELSKLSADSLKGIEKLGNMSAEQLEKFGLKSPELLGKIQDFVIKNQTFFAQDVNDKVLKYIEEHYSHLKDKYEVDLGDEPFKFHNIFKDDSWFGRQFRKLEKYVIKKKEPEPEPEKPPEPESEETTESGPKPEPIPIYSEPEQPKSILELFNECNEILSKISTDVEQLPLTSIDKNVSDILSLMKDRQTPNFSIPTFEPFKMIDISQKIKDIGESIINPLKILDVPKTEDEKDDTDVEQIPLTSIDKNVSDILSLMKGTPTHNFSIPTLEPFKMIDVSQKIKDIGSIIGSAIAPLKSLGGTQTEDEKDDTDVELIDKESEKDFKSLQKTAYQDVSKFLPIINTNIKAILDNCLSPSFEKEQTDEDKKGKSEFLNGVTEKAKDLSLAIGGGLGMLGLGKLWKYGKKALGFGSEAVGETGEVVKSVGETGEVVKSVGETGEVVKSVGMGSKLLRFAPKLLSNEIVGPLLAGLDYKSGYEKGGVTGGINNMLYSNQKSGVSGLLDNMAKYAAFGGIAGGTFGTAVPVPIVGTLSGVAAGSLLGAISGAVMYGVGKAFDTKTNEAAKHEVPQPNQPEEEKVTPRYETVQQSELEDSKKAKDKTSTIIPVVNNNQFIAPPSTTILPTPDADKYKNVETIPSDLSTFLDKLFVANVNNLRQSVEYFVISPQLSTVNVI